jgi:hypothetical protein
MKKRNFMVGIIALLFAAGTSAFTAKREALADPLVWFDPNSLYFFHYYGTLYDAVNFFGADPVGGNYIMSEGFFFYRNAYPSNANPFATVVYDAWSGDPSYGTELKLTSGGLPRFAADYLLWYY